MCSSHWVRTFFQPQFFFSRLIDFFPYRLQWDPLHPAKRHCHPLDKLLLRDLHQPLCSMSHNTYGRSIFTLVGKRLWPERHIFTSEFQISAESDSMNIVFTKASSFDNEGVESHLKVENAFLFEKKRTCAMALYCNCRG